MLYYGFYVFVLIKKSFIFYISRYNKIHVYNMDSDSFVLNDFSFEDTIKAGIYEVLYINLAGPDR